MRAESEANNMIGTIVNVGCILTGSFVGSQIKKGINEKHKTALFNAMGLAAIGIGTNSIAQNMPKSEAPVLFIVALALGSLVALGGRFVSHILSGYLLFSGWAEWFFTQDGFPAWGAALVERLTPEALGWVYSVVYNGLYMVPEMILTAMAAVLLARVPGVVKKVS